jgi:serpin B
MFAAPHRVHETPDLGHHKKMMRAFRSVPALILFPVLAMHAADPTAAAMNRFASELYQQFARGSDNLVLSPFSNHAALTMLLEGARGQTASQLARVLHLASSDSGHYDAATTLADQLTGHGNAEGSEMFTAQGLWIQRGFNIRTDYERTLEQSYHASVTQFDFAGNPEQARISINFWTANQTKGKIQELFAPGSLGKDTRMVVTSAIYFHGGWQTEFPFEDTHPAPFHTSARETVSVDTMNQTGFLGYSETPGLQVLELKYGRSQMVFDILLPKTIEGLKALEAGLTPEKLSGFWNSLSSRDVAVSLPRFRVETDVSLRDLLGHMGVTDAFSSAADFSRIDDKRDLMLAEFRHKAYIDVVEQGTIAAAVSAGTARLTATAAPPTVFRADHPFLFLIRDTHTGVILFTGRLMKPRQ